MNRSYYCSHCQLRFTARGKKKKRQDPIFGPVWHWQAECPDCGRAVKEDKKPLTSTAKQENSFSGSANSSAANTSSCATGSCPFVN